MEKKEAGVKEEMAMLLPPKLPWPVRYNIDGSTQ